MARMCPRGRNSKFPILLNITYDSFRILKSHRDLVISLSSILFNMESAAWDRVHTGENGVNGIVALSHVVEVSKNEPEVVKMARWVI